MLNCVSIHMYVHGSKNMSYDASTILEAKSFSRASIYESRHEISNNVVCATSKGSDQPVHMRSLNRAFASRLNIL